MWMFAKDGFVSIVEDREAPGMLLVRGRVRGDIEALFPGAKVEATPKRDYLYRTSLPREAVAVRVAEMVALIDYDNFKNSTALDRHAPYMNVWTTMYGLQQQRARPKRRNRRTRGRARLSPDMLVGYDEARPYFPWGDADVV